MGLAVVAAAFLMLISPVRVCSFEGTTERCIIQWDVVFRALAVAAPGLVASAAPVVALRSRRAATVRAWAAVVLWILSVAGFLLPPGLLFLPSAVAMSASAIGARRVNSRARAGRILAWISLALTVGAGVALLFIASGERCVTRGGAGIGAGEAGTVCSSTTLLESEGSSVIGILLIPVAIATVPVVAARHRSAGALRAISAILLMAFALLGMFSIGLFYIPAMLGMVAAASFGAGDSTSGLETLPQ